MHPVHGGGFLPGNRCDRGKTTHHIWASDAESQGKPGRIALP